MNAFVKTFKNLLFGFKGTLIYCPDCTSANVTYGKITNTLSDSQLKQVYPVKCNDCSAEGYITEKWNKL